MTTDELNFVLKARREKHDALLARGIAPYAYRFARTHGAAAAVAALGGADEGGEVRVAGRIVAWRGHGKTSFAHLADDSGRIQLYFRRDELGEELFETIALFDIGDVIGVTGTLFRTKTGEATVRVSASVRRVSTGSSRRHAARTSGQRDAKRQPCGRSIGLGISPDNDAFSGRSKLGKACISARVYGCSGRAITYAVGPSSTMRPRYITATRWHR